MAQKAEVCDVTGQECDEASHGAVGSRLGTRWEIPRQTHRRDTLICWNAVSWTNTKGCRILLQHTGTHGRVHGLPVRFRTFVPVCVRVHMCL